MAVDSVKVTLVTRDFNRMLEDLASIDPRVEFRSIVREVAIRVCAGALRRTQAADVQKIRRNHEKREWTTFEGKKYRLSYYYHNDALWGRISHFREQNLERKLNARGLSKQSWLHQARNLGGSIDVPAYVNNANFNGHQYPLDAASREAGGGADYALTIINSSPIVQKANGMAALVSAMAGETRYFYTLLKKHAFRTAASRAARYPGIFVTERPDSLAVA